MTKKNQEQTKMDFETKRGSSVKKFHPWDIKENPLQPRLDYGSDEEWQTFKNDLRENGQLVPIRYTMTPEGPMVTNGHRRVRAIMELREEGCEIEWVDALPEKRGLSEAEILIGMLSANTGKPLTAIEEAMAFKKLEAYGMTQADIARRRGCDPAHVSNRLKVANGANPKVINAVKDNSIRFTAALDIVKNASDEKEQVKMLQEEIKQSTGKGGRRKGVGETLKKAKEAKKAKSKKNAKPSIRNLSKIEINEQIAILSEGLYSTDEFDGADNDDVVKGMLLGLKIAAGLFPKFLPTGQLEMDVEKFEEIVAKKEMANPKEKKEHDDTIVDNHVPEDFIKVLESIKKDHPDGSGILPLDDGKVYECLPPIVILGVKHGGLYNVKYEEAGKCALWTKVGKVESGPGNIMVSC